MRNNAPFHSNLKHSRTGFSVIEALMAAVIVAIGVIPIFDMISQANQSMSSVEEETIAFGLASEVAEWLKAQNYSALEYPQQYLKVFPENCLQATVPEYFECIEEPVKSFKPASLAKDQVEISYEPAAQFAIYSRTSRIFKPVDGSLKIEVTVSWRSRLDPAQKREKSEVKLQFMRFM